jgi:hypothetical protein
LCDEAAPRVDKLLDKRKFRKRFRIAQSPILCAGTRHAVNALEVRNTGSIRFYILSTR